VSKPLEKCLCCVVLCCVVLCVVVVEIFYQNLQTQILIKNSKLHSFLILQLNCQFTAQITLELAVMLISTVLGPLKTAKSNSILLYNFDHSLIG